MSGTDRGSPREWAEYLKELNLPAVTDEALSSAKDREWSINVHEAPERDMPDYLPAPPRAMVSALVRADLEKSMERAKAAHAARAISPVKAACPETRIGAEEMDQLHKEGVACRKEVEERMKGMIPLTKKTLKGPVIGGAKEDSGKPRLSLFPVSYWQTNCHPMAEAMACWWFRGEALPLSLRFDALPAFEYGTIKYAPHNWLKGVEWSRFVDAYLRHVSVFNGDGSIWIPRKDLTTLDPESGLMHGCHAEFYLITLREYAVREIGIDDRPEAA